MPVYNRLLDELNERNISLREFSRMIDYSFESVRRFANDQSSSYSRELLHRTCVALEIDIGDLLYFSFKNESDGIKRKENASNSGE